MAMISVIIPLYNKANYIGRTLESVLRQTWQDFEVIVVDDGSTDDSAAVVKACDDPRVRLIHQPNQGPGAARNHGIRLSTASYLTFLDADDEWLPDFLERAVGTLTSQDECPVFVTNHFLGEGTKTYLGRHPDLPLGPGCCTLPTGLSPKTVKACVDLFAQGAAVIHREVMDHLGGYYEGGCTYGEDAYLWLRVLLNYPLWVSEEPLLRVRYDSSVLGYGRVGSYPVHALVEHAAEVVADCPDQHRELIKGVLDYYALMSLWRRIDCRDLASAQSIVANFPYSRWYRVQFLKARIKLGILVWIANHRISQRNKHHDRHSAPTPTSNSRTTAHLQK